MTTHGMTMFCIGYILGIASAAWIVFRLYVWMTKGEHCNREQKIEALERTLLELKGETYDCK